MVVVEMEVDGVSKKGETQAPCVAPGTAGVINAGNSDPP